MSINLNIIRERLELLRSAKTPGQKKMDRYFQRAFKKKFKISYYKWKNTETDITEDQIDEWSETIGWSEYMSDIYPHIKYAYYNNKRWRFLYKPETRHIREEMNQRYKDAMYW